MSEHQNSNKKKLKQYAVYAAMALLCAAFMWLIFSPSEKQKEQATEGVGLNTDIPEPSRKKGIIGDKKKAYEQQRMNDLVNDRMKTLSDFAGMVGNEKDAQSTEPDEPGEAPRAAGYITRKKAPESSLSRSTQAYKNMNRELQNFYAPAAKEDEEAIKMKKELERQKAQLAEQETQNNVDAQVELMEKSFQMASKYMPQTAQAPTAPVPTAGTGTKGQPIEKQDSDITEVSLSRENEVSALKQQLSDSEIVRELSAERNIGFYNGVSEGSQVQKNTIQACIHDDQVIEGMESSKSVRIRLQDDMMVGDMTVPRNTLLTGQAKILGERLDIAIKSIEYDGKIINVDIDVYDTDGQRGIFIPNSLELNAVKEMGANMGSSVGTSFTFSQSAGQQIAADLGKGVIQGASQYLSKKMRNIKISLKAGYRIFLLPKQNA